MKLWILRPPAGLWSPAENTVNGFVVRAETAAAARLLAREECGAEGRFFWMDAKLTSCDELRPEGDASIVMVESTPIDAGRDRVERALSDYFARG